MAYQLSIQNSLQIIFQIAKVNRIWINFFLNEYKNCLFFHKPYETFFIRAFKENVQNFFNILEEM